MKNTIFWFITFAIIVTVVGTTMIFTQDSDPKKNENKIWIVSGIAVCNVNPWNKDVDTRSMKETDQILHYYEKQNIEIYDMRIYIEVGTSRLEESCWLGDRLYLLVGESDAKHLLDESVAKHLLASGFRIVAKENVPKTWLDN